MYVKMEVTDILGDDDDLPLLSNTSDVLVRHFTLDLKCSIVDKKFFGSITLFLDLSRNGSNMQVFTIQEFQKRILEEMRKSELLTDCCESGNWQTNNFEKISKEDQSLNTDHHEKSTDLIKSSCVEHKTPFQLILDCCDLDIFRVEAIDCKKTYEDWLKLFSLDLDLSADEFLQLSRQTFSRRLHHSTEKWCLKMWDPDVFKPQDFAHCIKIYYSTTSVGSSLRWAMDQDENPCVYTAGMWINNRSLMPCQEYGSLSTWQAIIKVPLHLTVLMSGDNEGSIIGKDNVLAYHFKSRMPLPSYSLALAIGSWQHQVISSHSNICCNHDDYVSELFENKESEHTHIKTVPNSTSSTETHSKLEFSYLQQTCTHEPECYIPYCQTPVLPCRIFAPKSILPQAVAEFADVFPSYSVAVQKLLGPFPFPRLDVLIYPACSQDMAMSNPNLIFISQSMIAGDGSMQVNLGHELSHYWFGLLLGAKDWTEEWLSEGFATFVEYIVEADVRGWSEEEHIDHEQIVDYLRYKTLATEVSHTNPELQMLCPNHDTDGGNISKNFVKNGMNPYKLFTQVHYLKGYFLLRWLTQVIGHSSMRQLLREYIIQGHGRMVTSKDFLQMAFDCFPQLNQHHSIDDLCHYWLNCTGIPPELKDTTPPESNHLYQSVMLDLGHWEKLDRSFKHSKSTAKRRKSTFEGSSLNSKQILLLLNKLLEKRSLHKSTLTRVCKHYQLDKANAEIKHRWFELVIKHRYTPAYESLARYLVNHQAMGVYLYGEMVIARCGRLKSIAEKAFAEISPTMEPTTRKIVQRMLYGVLQKLDFFQNNPNNLHSRCTKCARDVAK